MYQASNLKGSRAYWNARSHELKDMVEQIGLPTIFTTLSCADGHWEDLYKILTSDDISTLSERDRRKLVQDNPHIVDSFFDYRVNSFIKKVLQVHYKITDYWYRIEYQHRGSPHIHGVFWIQDAPDVSNIENESEENILKVVEYFSKLIDAWNPIINPPSADTHPCRTNYDNVINFEEDLAQLLHMVQRHVCSNDYCYRVNKKTMKKECRFKFPREMQDNASIVKDDNNQFEFRPRRNDPNLNKFNDFLIQLWRANMDIAPVISKRALLAYLAKYISKSEVPSASLQSIFSTLIELFDGDMSAKKIIHKVFMKCCAERDISAQEVCHSLLRLKLYSAGGRQFVTVNLSEKKWLPVHDADTFDNDKYGTSILEKYQNRPSRLENFSLWNFARNLNSRTLSEVTKYNIVRVFPRLKLTNDNDKNEEFYKQQIILHVPWRDESALKSEDESWQTIYFRHNLNDVLNAINIVRSDYQNIDEEEYESSDTDQSDDEESNILEELLSSRLGPKSDIPKINLGNREVDQTYNWKDSFKMYESYGTIIDFENYVEKVKRNELEHVIEDQENHEDSLQLPNLGPDQEIIINLVKDQISAIKSSVPHNSHDRSCKRIIIQGKAGTGKSFIIKYITTLFEMELGKDSFIVATPTGVSAVLINAKTLHSVFKIPRKPI
ncbi:hypothetical protein KUF71_017471 [Frankliniella fusca]|uniref:ATP-dependent DNA helicase n=1 Tax=Frankliniella fusca TaxID=407009 RepID=A0AAE1IVF9_9NEOP|nr:hypothetical protein KUF71_017471 [Frankliniella fusca]